MYDVLLNIGNFLFDEHPFITFPLLILSYTQFGFNLLERIGWFILKPIFTILGHIISPIIVPLIKFKTRNMNWDEKLTYYRNKGVDVDAILNEERKGGFNA
ncbi:hypothetical protein ACPV5V_19335 [Vibrio campbellii]